MCRSPGRTTLPRLEVHVVRSVEKAILVPQRGPLPLAVLPYDAIGPAVGEGLRPHLGQADFAACSKMRSHPGVGRERFALGDAQRGQFAVVVAVAFQGGSASITSVQHFPVLNVVLPFHRGSVLGLLGEVQPLGLRPVGGRIERIDFNGCEALDGAFHIAVDR